MRQKRRSPMRGAHEGGCGENQARFHSPCVFRHIVQGAPSDEGRRDHVSDAEFLVRSAAPACWIALRELWHVNPYGSDRRRLEVTVSRAKEMAAELAALGEHRVPRVLRAQYRELLDRFTAVAAALDPMIDAAEDCLGRPLSLEELRSLHRRH